MPVKRRPRILVDPDDHIRGRLEKLAHFNRRNLANQIEVILDEFFAKYDRELEFFTPRLREAKQDDGIQVFETPPAPSEEQLSKRRAKVNPENT